MGRIIDKEVNITHDELLIAIHKHCLRCSGGIRECVRNCTIKDCDLYLYRQEPTRIREKLLKGQITLFDLTMKETQ